MSSRLLSVTFLEQKDEAKTRVLPRQQDDRTVDCHPTADSQIRYLGGILASSGAIVWRARNDVLHKHMPLASIGLGIFAGGLERWVAGVKYGFRPKTKLVMWVELVAPVVLYFPGKVAGQW